MEEIIETEQSKILIEVKCATTMAQVLIKRKAEMDKTISAFYKGGIK